MGHAVVRTNPKGRPFLGKCYKCGQENLGMAGALLPCPKDKEISDQQALFQILKEDTDASSKQIPE